MALFDSMFKPKWRHKDAKVRKAAINTMDDLSVLVEVINTDPDSEVRALALSRINNGETLDQLIDSLAHTTQKNLLQQAQAQRLQQLLPDRNALSSVDDDSLLIRIAALTEDDAIRDAAIDQLSTIDARMEIASHHPLAKVRLSAAQGIREPQALQQLMQQTQGKDKALYRYCKEQLKAHKAAQQAEVERQTRIQNLVNNAKRLSTSAETNDYRARYQLLEQQWQSVCEHASDEQLDQVNQYLALCGQRLSEKSAQLAAAEQQQTKAAAAKHAFTALIDEITAFGGSATSANDRETLSQQQRQLDALENRWQTACRGTPPPVEQAKSFRKTLQQWRNRLQTSQSLLEKQNSLNKLESDLKKADKSDFQSLWQLQQRAGKLLTSLPWPDTHTGMLPGALAQLRQQNEYLNERLRNLEQTETQNITRLENALDALQTSVDEKQLKNANHAHDAAKKALKTLSPEKQRRYQHQWRQLSARLNEIRDWQGFAIEPKKVALCERMEALIDSGDPADTLADKIQALQAEWKQLGAISPKRDQELWQRFNRAADQAWQPCREAFSEQAEARKQNLQQRLQLIDQLSEYETKMDWSSANWKAVQETLDTARKTFRDIGPVDKAGAKSSQQAFQTVSDKIYSHIKEEYERNIASKTALVEHAKTIADGCAPDKDIKPATEQIKLLQSQWKQIGITPVRVDRELWQDFRAACDTVFNHLGEQRQQHKAEIDAQVAQAEQLVHQAKALLEQNSDNPDPHLENRVGELQQNFRDIDLPKGAHIRLSKEFADIERQAQASARSMRQQRLRDSWQHLQNKLIACATKTTDVDAANSLWQQEGELPKGVDNDALDTWWQQGTGNADQQQLRELCIALEILVDIDSPEQDRQARMEWQVKRLASAMGQQRDDQAQSLVSLVNDCISLRPPHEWLQRFCNGLEKASF